MDNFDLKKYLVENKVTRNSRMLDEDNYDADFATIEQLLKRSLLIKSHEDPKGGLSLQELEDFISRNRDKGKFLWWYAEPGEKTGLQELSPGVALEVAKAVENFSAVPEGVVSGYESSLHFVKEPIDLEKLASVTEYPIDSLDQSRMLKEQTLQSKDVKWNYPDVTNWDNIYYEPNFENDPHDYLVNIRVTGVGPNGELVHGVYINDLPDLDDSLDNLDMNPEYIDIVDDDL
jgi:hypothetical protein